MTDSDLEKEFSEYGAIDYAQVVKDRNTNESKGFGYVKFKKISSAAKAFEECDKKFKAVFAEPKKPRNAEHTEKYSSNGAALPMFDHGQQSNNSSLVKSSVAMDIAKMHPYPEGFTKLQVIVHPALNQDQLWKLFDLVPGLDYCHVNTDARYRAPRGQAIVVYKNANAAAYAREKFHGFEYPLGHRMIVKPDMTSSPPKTLFRGSNPLPSRDDLAQLAETIAQATSLIQAAGLSTPSK